MTNVIIFPTDTVYGIGAKFDDIKSQKEIFKIKSRELNKRLAVLCFDLHQIKEIAYVSEVAEQLINKYMPGGLSIVLKTKEKYISEMIGDTIALRIPNHKIALDILRVNGPMATTSVNVSGENPLNDYNEICNVYKKSVNFIYENDRELEGVSSTVIDLTKSDISLIREGSITLKEIKEYLNV